MIEFALVVPVFVLLFVGVYDMGIWICSLIAVEDAVRTAALYTTSSDTTGDAAGACQYVLSNVQALPLLTPTPTNCVTSPVVMSGSSLASGPDGKASYQVTITYQTPSLITLPGFAGQVTITRTALMRVRT